MGASIKEMLKLSDLGVFFPRCNVLDIGAQNLYNVESKEFVEFMTRFNPIYDVEELTSYANTLSTISEIDPVYGGINGAWLGDLIRRAGMQYMAFDIFKNDDVVIIDLNRDVLPARYHNEFDICLNIGTTQHILNQLNSFKIMHEALKPGGFFYHVLPMTGLFDHGYFSYNPEFFESLAATNRYQIVDSRITVRHPIDYIKAYRDKYPTWKVICDESTAFVSQTMISLIARKTEDSPFWAPLDTTTTVGKVSDQIGPSAQPVFAEEAVTEEALQVFDTKMKYMRALLLSGGDVSGAEIRGLERQHRELSGRRDFCLFLEQHTLVLALASDPARDDLAASLDRVRAKISRKYPCYPCIEPLLPVFARAGTARHPALDYDLQRTVLSYWKHCIFDTLSDFPVASELELIEFCLNRVEDDFARIQLRLRRAELVGEMLRRTTIKLRPMTFEDKPAEREDSVGEGE